MEFIEEQMSIILLGQIISKKICVLGTEVATAIARVATVATLEVAEEGRFSAAIAARLRLYPKED